MQRARWLTCGALLLALAGAGGPARAASHSDAPLIKLDPQANLTDVYAFLGQNNQGARVLNVIVHVRPLCEPGDGVMYDRFSHDVLYSIHINRPRRRGSSFVLDGSSDIRYNFRFSPVNAGYKNLDTIISYGLGTEAGPIVDVGDARQNFTQTYTIQRTLATDRSPSRRFFGPFLCPPPNVGNRVTPAYNDAQGRAISGAASFDALDRYTRQTVFSFGGGERAFAGTREDGFFADVAGIFDLLDPRILGTGGNGPDLFQGYNVLAYALQIPVSSLDLPAGSSSVGVYATTSRPRIRLIGGDLPFTGPDAFAQVSRMGNPLFNEVLVRLRDKDRFNATQPTADNGSFRTYALNPEPARLLNAVYNLGIPDTGRTDIAGIYIPDVLNVDTTTPPVTLSGEAGFSRLSIFGGDTTVNDAGATVPSGWPNGRRLGDDVIDIALSAVASPPGAPLTLLGDNVDSNDQVYNLVFPYSATPWAGTNSRKDPPSGIIP